MMHVENLLQQIHQVCYILQTMIITHIGRKSTEDSWPALHML